MPRLIIASHNQGKIREFTEILGNRWVISPQADHGVPEVAETGATFVENALIKARHACRATGYAALADDSGLVVPALGGDPGLRSARYSGHGDQANNALLLENMAPLSGEDRSAFYIAVLVILQHADDPAPHCRGPLVRLYCQAPRGDGGFGYDPLFIPDGESRHAAELTADEKNLISHRGKALKRLIKLAQG